MNELKSRHALRVRIEYPILSLLFFIFINLLNAQPYLLDGHRCDSLGTSTEWGMPTLMDGDDGEAGTSEIIDVWSTIEEDTLWFALSRESGGAATWVVFMDADCNPGTGPQDSINEPYRYGAEIGLGFKWEANSPTITGELFVWDPNAQPNGKYVSAVDLTQIGLQGNLICGDNTTEGWFGEFFILIEDIIPLGFDPCSDCGSIKIPGFASLAGGDPNSATKDEAFPDVTEADIILQYNASPIANFTISQTSLCLGDTIFLDASGSIDTFPIDDTYSVQWDFDYDGVQFDQQNTNFITSYIYAQPGTYEIALIVTDQFDCSDTLTEIVNVFDNPVVQCQVDQHVSCFGGTDGIASVNITGGQAPFTIAWSDGQSGETASGLGAGMYSVIITDANLCQSDTCYIEILEPPLLTASISGTCADETQQLVNASAVPSGGTPPYSYIWSNGATTQDIINVPAGQYDITIMDALGCIAMVSMSVECCSLELTCAGQPFEVYNCLDEVPAIPVELTDTDPSNDSLALETLGFMITSSCGQVTAMVSDQVLGGSGCQLDTLMVERIFQITDGVTIELCTLNYHVADTLAPSFDIVPQDLNVNCQDPVETLFTDWLNQNGMASATDQCGGIVSWSNNQNGTIPDFTTGSPIVVWFYISDVCGNIDSASAFFNVACINTYKIAGDPVPAMSGVQGNFDMTFTFIVMNTGNVPLNEIIFIEDLVSQLGGAFVQTTLPVIQNIQTDGILPMLNSAYDGGVAESQVFTGGGLLDPGQMISFDLIVEIDPDAPDAVFNATGNLENQANTTAEDPDGNLVEDDSDDSDEVPTTGDMMEDLDDPTPFDIPAIGVAKAASVITPHMVIGQYEVTYSLVIQNLGSIELSNVTLTDDLVNQLGSAFVSSIPPVISNVAGLNGAIAPGSNPAYDGGVTSDSIFLANGGGILPVGGSIILDITIIVAPNAPGAPAPLLNQATATGTDPDGNTVNDLSDDGIDPSGTNPDGGGDTGSPDDPTLSEIQVAIFCPADVTLECDASTDTTFTGSAVAFGNCVLGNTITISFVDDISGMVNCNGIAGQIVRTWTANDPCGNSVFCDQILTIVDTTAPQILSCPTQDTIECDEVMMAELPVATDNCDMDLSIDFSDITVGFDGSCTDGNIGQITRTFTVSDDCNNSTTCTQIILVEDTEAPVLVNCPANIQVSCDSETGTDILGMPTATDACSATVTIENQDVLSGFDGTCSNLVIGTITRTFSASDNCGNISTCEQLITIVDDTPPTITLCPADTIISCTESTDISMLGDITATDNCSAEILSTFTDVTSGFDGSCSTQVIGTIERTFSAEDNCGNIATCIQLITVQDTTAPMITFCPADTVVDCTSATDPVTLGDILAEDNCGEETINSFEDVISGFDGTCTDLVLGTIERTFTATDPCGNESSCVQMISVQDTVAPDLAFDHLLLDGIENGGTIYYECFGQDENWTLPDIDSSDIIITDNCGDSFDIQFADSLVAEGDCATDGFFVRYRCEWTVSDACGNTSTLFFFLEIVDNIAPVLSGVPNDTIVSCDQIPPVAEVTASDACLCAHVEFSESLLDESTCVNGQKIIRTWIATDHCGNTSSAIQEIQVIDDQGPSIRLVAENIGEIVNGGVIQFDCNTGGFPWWFNALDESSIELIDNCSPSLPAQTHLKEIHETAVHCDEAGFIEQITYIWTAEDACGNVSKFTFKGQLIDTVAPVFLDNEAIVCGYPDEQVFAYDECAPGSIRFTIQDTEIANACGIVVNRIYQAVDGCGNESYFEQVIYPENSEGPEVTFTHPDLQGSEPGGTVHIQCVSENGTMSGFDENDIEILGSCGPVEIKFSESIIDQGNCLNGEPLFVIELQWILTDHCGNNRVTSLNAIIQDDEAPVFINLKEEMKVSCGSKIPLPEVLDNCGKVDLTYEDSISPGGCPGEEVIERKYFAIDICGNTTEAMQTITIVDETGPEFLGIAEVVCAGSEEPNVVAWDACSGIEIPATILDEKVIDPGCHDGVILERTWVAEDACGNTSSFTQLVQMEDTVAPVIEFLDRELLELVNAGVVTLYQSIEEDMMLLEILENTTLIAHDPCENDMILDAHHTYVDRHCMNGISGIHQYVWIAEDMCGNKSTIEIQVEVYDDVPPVFINMPADTVLYCVEIPELVYPETFDLSPVIDIDFVETVTNLSNGLFIQRTWTADDECGNSSSATQDITILDGLDLNCNIQIENQPECNSHNNQLWVEVTGGAGPYTYKWKVINGNCLIYTQQNPDTILFYQGFNDIVIGVEVTDGNGCTTYCEIEIDCIGKDSKSGVPSFTIPGQNGSSREGELEIYPNPVTDNFNMKFTSSIDQSGDVTIFNELGQVIETKKMILEPGIQTFSLSTFSWPKGIYFVSYRSAFSNIQVPFVKE